MKSLANRSLRDFFFFTSAILLCCAPLMFFFVEKYYTEDLDELIEYRRDEFIEFRLPEFCVDDVFMWNKYNEDLLILPFDEKYLLGKPLLEEFFNKAEGHSIDYRTIYEKIEVEGIPYALVSRIPMIERHDLWRMLLSQYGVLFITLLISLVIVYYHMSKKLWAPFYRTLDAASQFNLEQGRVPSFAKAETKEFDHLNEILTGLLSENIQVYQHQKKFIENASHELQTPLAILLSQLDMLLQEPNLTEQQMEVIQSLYSVASRMTRLNKNLLLLAKIDNAQFEGREQIDFNELLQTQLSYFRYVAESNGITVSLHVEDHLVLRASKVLTESLVNNLIINAIRHNVGRGRIEIEVTRGAFVVRNTGEKKALDSNRIFERFSRTSEKKKGNGLGLSIVAQISKSHNWELSYAFDGTLHCFTVKFG